MSRIPLPLFRSAVIVFCGVHYSRPVPHSRGISAPRFTVVLTLLVAAAAVATPSSLPAPQNLRVDYSEKALDLNWDSVPGAAGYHIYTSTMADAPPAKQQRVNRKLITSGTHFTYLWNFVDGERVRAIKGREHHLCVRAVRYRDTDSAEVKGPCSPEVDNCYFDGFRKVLTAGAIENILVDTQLTARLPVKQRRNSADSFIRFMAGPGRLLSRMVRDSLNALLVGGCAPVSVVLVKALDAWGLSAHRVEGTFIKEYHAFVVLDIEGAEYILDFTADQFVPDVSPVLLPRDLAHLTSRGRFGARGKPVYRVAKIYTAGQSSLTDSEDARVYRDMLERVREKIRKAYKPGKR